MEGTSLQTQLMETKGLIKCYGLQILSIDELNLSVKWGGVYGSFNTTWALRQLLCRGKE